MDIAVAVRLMPKAGEELELDASGLDIDREDVELTLCDSDDQALEEAVLIKEATGATVTAVGLRADGIEQALRAAYARGADRVVIVEAGALDPYDSRGAALAFAAALGELAPDLILVGVQTPSDVFGQTAPVLAAALDRPQANVAVGVSVVGDHVRVTQEYAGGRLAVLELALPAVVGVQSASAPPRYISMMRLRQAMSEASPSSLTVPAPATGPRPELVALTRPAPREGAEMLEGDAETVATRILSVLRERGALIA